VEKRKSERGKEKGECVCTSANLVRFKDSESVFVQNGEVAILIVNNSLTRATMEEEHLHLPSSPYAIGCAAYASVHFAMSDIHQNDKRNTQQEIKTGYDER
jgi:hypothetical protein